MTPGRADPALIAELCLPAMDRTTPVILSRVLGALRRSGYGQMCDTVQIVLAEALNNVAEHAYPAVALGAVAVRVDTQAAHLRIRITDWGLPVPPATLAGCSAPDPLELAEGGYGWFLIRSLVADLAYGRQVCRNDLILRLDM